MFFVDCAEGEEELEEELGRKTYKKLMKAGNLKNYLIAVRDI